MIRDFKAQIFCRETNLSKREIDTAGPIGKDRIDAFFRQNSQFPPDGEPTEYAKPDVPRVTLEQKDAKVFFQRFHAGANDGLRHAERIGGVAEVEIFRNCKCLNQSREGDAGTE